MDIETRIEELTEEANTLISELKTVPSEKLGLDPRAAWGGLRVSDNFVAVEKQEDRTLQYYGGFEYIEDECRKEFGDWVLYYVDQRRDHCRVQVCLDNENENRPMPDYIDEEESA